MSERKTNSTVQKEETVKSTLRRSTRLSNNASTSSLIGRNPTDTSTVPSNTQKGGRLSCDEEPELKQEGGSKRRNTRQTYSAKESTTASEIEKIASIETKLPEILEEPDETVHDKNDTLSKSGIEKSSTKPKDPGEVIERRSTRSQNSSRKNVKVGDKKQPFVILTPIEREIPMNQEKLNPMNTTKCEGILVDSEIINEPSKTDVEGEFLDTESETQDISMNDGDKFSLDDKLDRDSINDTNSSNSQIASSDMEEKQRIDSPSNTIDNEKHTLISGRIDENPREEEEENYSNESPRSTAHELSSSSNITNSKEINFDRDSSAEDGTILEKCNELSIQEEQTPLMKVLDVGLQKTVSNEDNLKDSKSTESVEPTKAHADPIYSIHGEEDEEKNRSFLSSDETEEVIQKNIISEDEQDVSRVIADSDIDSKINKLLSRTTISDSENEDNQNPFLDSMAEEGEEDTPSEGSNDIIEVGEEINTTESELSGDESYENDSFIDDEEDCQLLSGEEYDLSIDQPKKKTRILQLSSGSDDEIITINRPKKEKPKKQKKSRIITLPDSSDEDVMEIDTQDVNEKSHISDDIHSRDINEESVIDNEKALISEEKHIDEIILLETQDVNKKSHTSDDIQSRDINEESVIDNEKAVISEEKHIDEIILLETNDKCDEEELKCASSTPIKEHNTVHHTENEETNVDAAMTGQDDNHESSPSSALVNVSITKQSISKKIILENIKVEDTSNTALNEQIKKVIDSLSPKIQNVREVSINLSVSYLNEKDNAGNNLENSLSMKIYNAKATNLENEVQIVDTLEKNVIKRRNKKRKKSHKDLLIKENKESDVKVINEENTKTKKDKIKKKKPKKNSNELVENKQGQHSSRVPENIDVSNDISNRSFKKKNKKVQTEEIIAYETKGIKRKFYEIEIRNVEPSYQSTNKDFAEETHIKKKKYKPSKDGVSQGSLQLNILDEALLYNKNNFLKTSAPLCDDWNIKSTTIKPHYFNEMQATSWEQKSYKCGKNGNSAFKKFSSKDFKNMMLYDSSRVKRIATKQLLKKKNF